jgi:hypothetical protein
MAWQGLLSRVAASAALSATGPDSSSKLPLIAKVRCGEAVCTSLCMDLWVMGQTWVILCYCTHSPPNVAETSLRRRCKCLLHSHFNACLSCACTLWAASPQCVSAPCRSMVYIDVSRCFNPSRAAVGSVPTALRMSLIFLLDGRKPDQAGLAVGGSYVCEEVVFVKRHERALLSRDDVLAEHHSNGAGCRQSTLVLLIAAERGTANRQADTCARHFLQPGTTQPLS